MDKLRGCLESVQSEISTTLIKIVIGTSAVVVVGVAVKKYQAAKDEARLREKWASVPKDTVVLHQFLRTYTCPSPSPFVVKPDCDHDFPDAARADAYELLEHTLGSID